jgi:ABC-2 type transport system ATP-binding protein
VIRDLAAAGTTVLLTTHYLDEAEALADRVGVIAHGRLVAAATPAELGGRAESAVTVSWLGASGLCSERTQTPTAFIQTLAGSLGGEVPGLTVTRPTLEDVYLSMIGEAP